MQTDTCTDALTLKDQAMCYQEHKPLNHERAKNKRTYHSIHDFRISLNKKCRNTHLALNEE
jgi:hypothetical protein